MAVGSHRVVQAPRPGMPKPRDCLQPRTLRTRHESAAVYVPILAAANNLERADRFAGTGDAGKPGRSRPLEIRDQCGRFRQDGAGGNIGGAEWAAHESGPEITRRLKPDF